MHPWRSFLRIEELYAMVIHLFNDKSFRYTYRLIWQKFKTTLKVRHRLMVFSYNGADGCSLRKSPSQQRKRCPCIYVYPDFRLIASVFHLTCYGCSSYDVISFTLSLVKEHGSLYVVKVKWVRYHCILSELSLCWRYEWSGLHLSYAVRGFSSHFVCSPSLVYSSTHDVTGPVLVKIMRRIVRVKAFK